VQKQSVGNANSLAAVLNFLHRHVVVSDTVRSAVAKDAVPDD
jgi:hypothetical protein